MLYSNLPDMTGDSAPERRYRRRTQAHPKGYGQDIRPAKGQAAYRSSVPRQTSVQPSSIPASWYQPQQTRAEQPWVWKRPDPAPGPAPVAQNSPNHRKAPLFAVFAVLILGFIFYHSYVQPGKVTHAISRLTTTSAEREAAAQQARLATYKSTVTQIIAGHPNQNIAVSSIDLSDNSLTSLGDMGTFTGASTAKLITAITVLHQVQLGSISLNDEIDGVTVRTLLQNMVVNSDNDAWQALNDYITHDTLKAYMSRLGWSDYDPDVNTFLPADMARLMEQLYEGKLLDTTNTQRLLGLMQQANKQEYIVADVHAAGSQYTVYHKAGWLDGLMHDVAIITDGKRTIVLTIYTYTANAQGDSSSTQATFRQIVDAALAAYFPTATSS